MASAPDRLRPPTPRIRPLEEPSGEVAELLAKAMLLPSGKPINIFSTLAHHPKLLKRFNVLGGFFLNSGLLPAREREIVILRVGYNCSAVYEFGQHTVIGKRVGITDDEIAAVCQPVHRHPWSADDQALLALADDLCADDCVTDATWAALQGRWNDAELIELVMVAGMYRMVSGFLNSLGIELDEGIPGWPTPKDHRTS